MSTTSGPRMNVADAMRDVTALINSAMIDNDSGPTSRLSTEEQGQIRALVDRCMVDLPPQERANFLNRLRNFVRDDNHRHDTGMTSVLGGAARAFLDVSALNQRDPRARPLDAVAATDLTRAAIEAALATDVDVSAHGMADPTRISLRDTFVRVLSRVSPADREVVVTAARRQIDDATVDAYSGELSAWGVQARDVFENAFQFVLSPTTTRASS